MNKPEMLKKKFRLILQEALWCEEKGNDKCKLYMYL